MTDPVPANEIERIVGVSRHDTDHIGRAVSAEQRLYILHPKECLATQTDARSCEFSVALDNGIMMSKWGEFEDRPMVLGTFEGRLIPTTNPEETAP